MRSFRLTRSSIIDAEAQQAEVVAELTTLGEDDLANRLAQCQSARLWRGDGWLWRCRLAGCWSCRRTMMRTWWTGIQQWAGPQASLVSIPLGVDILDGMRRLRRGLRDVRDRAAQKDRRWKTAAFAGMVSGETAMVFSLHPGIPLVPMLNALRQRWPTVAVAAANVDPLWQMTVDATVRLSVMRRGIEPLRAIIMPQAVEHAPKPASETRYLEPMPVLI